MKSARAQYVEQRKRALRACRFPTNTCGASRHAFQIAERLADHPPPGDLGYDWTHEASSIMCCVAMLWELRTKDREDHSA